MASHDQLLAECAHLIGRPELAFDDELRCVFVDDAGIEIELEFNAEENSIFVIASPGFLPEEAREAYMRFLLRCNLFGHGTGQATVGVHDDDKIFVHMAHAMQILDVNLLFDMIGRVQRCALCILKSTEDGSWRQLIHEDESDEAPREISMDPKMFWIRNRA